MSGNSNSETRRLRSAGWNLVRDDEAGRERWLGADDDGEIVAHIEIEGHRAVAYVDDDKATAVNIRINSVTGAHSRPDGFGMADNASRKAVLHAVMQALAAHLPL